MRGRTFQDRLERHGRDSHRAKGDVLADGRVLSFEVLAADAKTE
jgi:hypothetical protein